MKTIGLFKAFNMFYSSSKCNSRPTEQSSSDIDKLKNMVYEIHRDEFTITHIKSFLTLMEDKIIEQFLEFDNCYRLADRYLLIMVFVYFIRAKLPHSEYTRINFFVALYLAHDMEEDDENLKCYVMRWGLGRGMENQIEYFLQLRDNLWIAMDFRAFVSFQCSVQVMECMPDCPLWERQRSIAHAGSVRVYEPEEECNNCRLEEIRFFGSDVESEESDCNSSDEDEDDMPPFKRMRLSEE